MNGRLTSFLVATVLSAAFRPPRARRRGAAARRSRVRAAVEVTALDLDVVVTKNGTFVNDLRKEDFVVKVDGKPSRSTTSRRSRRASSSGPISPTPLPTDPRYLQGLDRRPLSRPPVPSVLRRRAHDAVRPAPGDRGSPGPRHASFPLDQAALISYNRGSSRVLVPFTNSKESLFDGLSGWPTSLPAASSGTRVSSSRDGSPGRPDHPPAARAPSASGPAGRRPRSRFSPTSAAPSSALAARSGKRTFLYISSGLELRPGQSFAQAVSPRLLQQFEYTVIPEYEKVVREANASA